MVTAIHYLLQTKYYFHCSEALVIEEHDYGTHLKHGVPFLASSYSVKKGAMVYMGWGTAC